MEWHSVSAEEALSRLSSSVRGLSWKEAEERLKKYGLNMIREEKRISPLKIFIDQFKSFLIGLLIFSMFVSWLIGEVYDALAIAFIVVANAVIGFNQEYRAEKALESLKQMLTPTAKVLRDGKLRKIPATKVVPGDILVLDAGDRIAADGRLIYTSNFQVDESMLTGESTPVSKDSEKILKPDTPLADRVNMVYMGTITTRGTAKAVVTATGMNTEFGKIAGMVQKVEREQTPLMRRLEKFGRKLGIFVLFLCLVAMVVQRLHGLDIIHSFMTAIALAVSAVPEGLPAVLTVTLALGMREMAKRNAVVRRLASVETLGSTTVICADKTGTITKNEMTVRKVYVDEKEYEVTGSGYNPSGSFLLQGQDVNPLENKVLEKMMKVFLLCNNSDLQEEGGEWRVVGDPTEGALLALAIKAGMWKEEVFKDYPEVARNPFDSRRKRMSTIHKHNSGTVMLLKGAPEVVLELSEWIETSEGVKKLTEEEKHKILNKTMEYSKQALRVIAAAYRELEADVKVGEEAEKNLVFLGLAAMIDPPRDEVPEAIKKCKEAGIRVIMITGDHRETAIAIARMIGLIDSNPTVKVYTGVELDKMDDETLCKVVEEVSVFARVSPSHKVRIAQALKKNGHVVAMTGDGVNDAPAVKTADVGVAMGIKGTEVTKEASDMVLLDDNFATIVKAVEMGRAIYDNIRKFVRFLLACNFDEIAVISVAGLAGLPLPLKPLQILWLNLATDGLPATALAFDPPDKDIMKRKPRSPKEGLLHGMTKFVAVSALLQFLATMIAFIAALIFMKRPYEEANTLAFTVAVMFELFVVFNCRSETRSIWRNSPLTNKKLFASVILNIPIHLAIVYWPPLQAAFETTSLTLQDWGVAFALGSIGLLVVPELFMNGKSEIEM